MLVIALDVGTSSARAIAFEVTGQAVPGTEAHVPYEPAVTSDGGVELDPDALVEAVAAALDGCLVSLGPRVAEAVGVGASVFWHSVVGLDAGGAPLTRVITWADTRSAGDAAELRDTVDERAIHARTGAPLHSSFFPAKLRWLRRTRPDIWGRVARWCGFAEYLRMRLTGRTSTSISMASGTGLMDQRTGSWDRELLDVCGIGIRQLPEIDDAPAPGLTPRFAARLPALARARWYPAHGDGACSNVGSDCSGPDRIALNVGTSSAMRLVSPGAFGVIGSTPWGLWRYRIDSRRALVGGATSEGGNVAAWCRRVLALPAGDEELARAVAEVPADGHGLTALPLLAGERSPGWRGDARAVIAGLSLGTTAAGIIRAMMEAVACRLALVYERLAPLATPGHAVIVSGGALARSPVWAAIIADAIGVPLVLSSEVEASARGAALLALAAEGAPSPPPLALGPVFHPDATRHSAYLAQRLRQERLYDNVVGPGGS